MKTRLQLRGIELKIGMFQLVVELDVQVGCCGIFGPSGSGKTTLLELIAGLRRQDAGQLEFDGKQLADGSRGDWVPVHRRRIGYVPQDLALFTHLNVRDNLAYGVSKNGRPAKEAPTLKILCEILGLVPFLDRRPHDLSGGERQRVALARALAADPRLLLLDEPLTGLDQDRKDTVLRYLQMLRERWAVPMIYVSHQPDEMVALCDQVVVLREGAVQRGGTPAEIFQTSDRPSYCLRPEPGHPRKS